MHRRFVTILPFYETKESGFDRELKMIADSTNYIGAFDDWVCYSLFFGMFARMGRHFHGISGENLNHVPLPSHLTPFRTLDQRKIEKDSLACSCSERLYTQILVIDPPRSRHSPRVDSFFALFAHRLGAIGSTIFVIPSKCSRHSFFP